MLKKNLFRIVNLTICILLISFFPVFAEPNSDQKDQNIDLIIEKSGILAQVNVIPGLFNKQELIKEETEEEETERSQQNDAILKNGLTAENLLAGIQQIFLKYYNEKNVQVVLKFYDSELGAKIAQSEALSADPAFTEQIEGFDIENYDSKRRQIINRLFDDMKILSYYSGLRSIALEFMFRSINAALPKNVRSSDADIIKLSKKLKSLTNIIFSSSDQRTSLIRQYYIMYENITTGELMQYDKYVKSKSGKWMTQCIQNGMVNGMKICSDQMIIDLTAYTDNQPEDESEEAEEVEEVEEVVMEDPGDI